MPHPIRFRDDDPLLARLRTICLALPGAQEKVSHGRPNFHTTKAFAYYGGTVKASPQHIRYDRSVLVLADPDERPALLDTERFFDPAYLGPSGWIGYDLAAPKPDWTEVAELVETSYRRTAARRLVTELDSSAGRSG